MFTGWKKWGERRCCCSPPSLSRPLATAPTFRKIPCPCSPTESCPISPTSFRWVEWCWAASGGSRTGEKRSRSPKAGSRRTKDRPANPRRRTPPRKMGGSPNAPHRDVQAHFLEGDLSPPDGGRPLRYLYSLHSGSRRLDAPQRSIPLGHLDQL